MNIALLIIQFAIVIAIYVLIDWIAFTQLEKDNKTGLYLLYLVISALGSFTSGKFSLASIIGILIGSLISYGFSIFCYNRCKKTFGSYLLTGFIWGIIFGLILYGIYFAIAFMFVSSIR
jgi:hypothetical protein